MNDKNDKQMVMEGAKVLDGRRALDVKVVRNAKDGLQISFQSSLDWSFLRAKENKLRAVGKVPCYYPSQDRLPDIPGYFIGEDWESEDYPNLSMLLAKDLDKGVVFNFGVIPVSDDKISNWIAKLKEQVKALYLSYLKPINIDVFFTTETVERSTEH